MKDDLNPKLYSNGLLDLVRMREYDGVVKMAAHERVHADCRARMAGALIQRWGMVAAITDGEDSAGRSKLRLMTVPELVARACDTAAAALAAFSERGWLVDVPDYLTLIEEQKKSNR